MSAPTHSNWLASKWRYRLILGFVTIGFAITILKSGSLQLIHGEALRGLAEKQYKRTLQVSSARGMIYDREGRTLAGSVPMESVFAEPRHIEDKELTVEQLAKVLELPPKKLRKRLMGQRSFAWIKRRVPPKQIAKVKQLGLRGIGFLKEHRRYYPNHAVAGQLLGTVSIDGEGQGGIEQALNKELRPKALKKSVLRDARGHRLVTNTGFELDYFRGDDVYLTLDAHLQQVAETVLAQTVKDYKAKSAWALAMDPKTGEILVMATAPEFNPNTPGHNRGHARNLALSAAFEPGSTMKAITFTAALDAQVVAPNESIDCENGKYKLGRHTIRDSHKDNWLTVRDVFKHSSNIGTLKIALALGEDPFKSMLHRMHFGERLGLGLLGEAKGRLPKKEKWGQTRLATISFGHGLMVTSVQMVAAVGAIANGGVWVKPKLISHTTNPFGEEIMSPTLPQGEPLFSKETADVVTSIMTSVVEEGGTGTKAAIPGIKVAGKTGTAEKVDPVTGRYSNDLHLSSFIGFAPADDPVAVILVVVDEPQEKVFGGLVAAPAFREIMETILRDQGIFPQQSDTERQKFLALKKKQALKAAENKKVALPLPVEPVAEGQMPDLRGMTLKEALVFLTQRGMVPQVEGRGRVTTQTPTAGALLGQRSAIQLVLKKEQ
jgi:cell division protein FtsI (penicillin-binding protein 3)